MRYPTNHVIGVLDSAEQVAAAVTDLTAGGFMDSEVHVQCGPEHARTLEASTGRRGLEHLAIRIAEFLGIEDIEMERKDAYEAALRNGHFVILVAAATDARKDRAVELLAKHDAHTVSFHGRFTIEDILPPNQA